MAEMTITVSGLSELEARLQRLPSQIAKQAFGNALKQAGEVVRQEIETRAPVATDEPTSKSNALPPGKLKASIISKVSLRPQQGSGVVTIGPSEDVNYVARFIELGFTRTGHKPGKKKGAFVGGKPFVRPAFDTSAQRALDKFSEALEENLDAAVSGSAA